MAAPALLAEVAGEGLALAACFALLAQLCDDRLLPALETLCVQWRLREDVAGASVLAFGSAAPEIVINLVTTVKAARAAARGAYDPSSALGVSAVLGSAMIAFTAIPALCVLGTRVPEGGSLELKRRPLGRDVLFYAFALCALIAALRDNALTLTDGLGLLALYFLYMCTIYFSPAALQYYRTAVLGLQPQDKPSFVPSSAPGSERASAESPLLDEAGDAEAGAPAARAGVTVGVHSPHGAQEPGPPKGERGEGSAGGNGTAGGGNGGNGWTPSLHGAGAGRRPAAGAKAVVAACGSVLLAPVDAVVRWSVPLAAPGRAGEGWYPLALGVCIAWIAAVSLALSAIVERWVQLSGLPMPIFGFALVAAGAEIPDAIQSLAVARRGYGSMAVASCFGSQNINVLVGLGLPWTVVNAMGYGPVRLEGHQSILVLASMQLGLLGLLAALTLGAVLVQSQAKAKLTRAKGWVLLAAYAVCVAAFGVYAGRCGGLAGRPTGGGSSVPGHVGVT